MASIGLVNLTIAKVPHRNNFVLVNVKYQLAGDAFDVALQNPYHEICQLIGDDTPGDGTDDILRTLLDTTTFFPDPDTSNPILERSLEVLLPLSALDEDSGGPLIEEDEIRAKVTLIPRFDNYRESNLVRVGGPPPPVLTQ